MRGASVVSPPSPSQPPVYPYEHRSHEGRCKGEAVGADRLLRRPYGCGTDATRAIRIEGNPLLILLSDKFELAPSG